LPDDTWDLLDALFAAKRILSHKFVFAEICPKTTKPDFLAKWIKNKEQYFYPVTTRQTQLVEQILSKFPALINHAKEIDEADPWIVSLAIEKRESTNLIEDYSTLTVVSNESGKSGVKIPAVCRAFNVPHMNLKEFIVDNGWKIVIEK
jgi:tryptophan synthase alpha subunit